MSRGSGQEVLVNTDRGLYCAAGDFYIDPWRPVERAVITHAHSDHARYGMGKYLCADRGADILRLRVGTDARIEGVPFGQSIRVGEARVSLHPAGHILGSAQVRVEVDGEVWVVSGDYKTEADATCDAFEPVRCHTFISECTFGLPIYHWPPQDRVRTEILDWWQTNQREGRTSILMGYALGKAQRAIAGLNPGLGPIVLHGALTRLTQAYRDAGIELPPTISVIQKPSEIPWSECIVLAPPSAWGTPWLKRFGDVSGAFLSGWMTIRGARRRRAVDRGFVMSDHVDWPSLLAAVDATGAERVLFTHGYTEVVARYFREQGRDARTLETAWMGEAGDGESEVSEE